MPLKSTRPSAMRASAARPALLVGFGTPPASGAETTRTRSVQRRLHLEVDLAAAASSPTRIASPAKRIRTGA